LVAWTPSEHATWAAVVAQHRKTRAGMLCDAFLNGVDLLRFSDTHIPDLEDVNSKLQSRTGFRGVFVKGLEEGPSFFQMLARREFPIGCFIRSQNDLNYTPAPDVIHDLYGHLPFYTDPKYADFCCEFGKAACRYANRPEVLRQFERYFWFTIEFGLLMTSRGLKIFGAGIASSLGECEYALSGQPEIRPFDIDSVRRQEFRIDEMQKVLFRLESVDQLYGSLDELCRRIESESK
jgi:phenylalanine-4-hydroxylase